MNAIRGNKNLNIYVLWVWDTKESHLFTQEVGKKNITRTHAVICKKNLGMVCSKRFKSEVQIRRRAESRGFESEGDATESLEHVLPG